MLFTIPKAVSRANLKQTYIKNVHQKICNSINFQRICHQLPKINFGIFYENLSKSSGKQAIFRYTGNRLVTICISLAIIVSSDTISVFLCISLFFLYINIFKIFVCLFKKDIIEISLSPKFLVIKTIRNLSVRILQQRSSLVILAGTLFYICCRSQLFQIIRSRIF